MQRIKAWDDAYDEPTLKRIGNLRPHGATRMGAFIRHSGWMLSQRPQGRRILIILSDGRPEDQGEYRGKYGVHDTALAVTEARRHGVYIFCISMDTSEGAEEYLQKIFGPKNYLVLDRVDDLPTRLPEVFRALIR